MAKKLRNPDDKRFPALVSDDVERGEIVMWEKNYFIGTGLKMPYINKLIGELQELLIRPSVIIEINKCCYGTPYNIETGVTVVVDNDCQYFLRDHLFLSGGSLLLNGSAQLIVD